MYQHIGVTRVSESGVTLGDDELNFAPVLDSLETRADYKLKYPWLSTIDPYGNTIVNALQRSNFQTELEVLKSETDNADLVEIINRTIEQIATLGGHEYLKFIGD